jgi:MFS family permease
VRRAIISGYLANAISRKWTKVLSGSVYTVAALLCAACQSVDQLIVSRFVLGLAVGTASFVSPMYISELAPKRLRGAFTSFNQLMVTLGIFVAYIANWSLKGVGDNWRWMLGLAAIPGAALAIGMLFLPHSPRWLMDHGREDEAREVLERLRATDAVDEELDEIPEAASQTGSLGDLVSPRLRRVMAVGIGLAIFQQIVGVNTVIYHAPTILQFTGLGAGSAITEARSSASRTPPSP